ncbi:MAG: glycosyltransferase [Bacteroidota bacterium]
MAEKPKVVTVVQLTKLIKEFQPNAVVSHGYSEHIWGRIASLIAKVPVIIQVEHNNEKYQPQQYLESRILSHYTAKIICVSHGVKNYLIKKGFSPHKMQVIYNGIELDHYSTPVKETFAQRQPNVIMVARFARQKDHATLIKAAGLLRELPFEVIIVGAGKKTYRQKNEGLVRNLGLETKVHFLGARNDIPSLLSQNQIFVLATHYEGLPLVVVEAMAAGCVVIGSDVTGVSELIQDGKTGFLVPPENPEALAEKIKFIFENQTLASAIAEAGREFAYKNFALERMVSEYENLLLAEINDRSQEKVKGDN